MSPLEIQVCQWAAPQRKPRDPGPCSSSAQSLRGPSRGPSVEAPGEVHPAPQRPRLLAHQLLYFPIFFLLELLNEAFKYRHLELYILGHLGRKKQVWVNALPSIAPIAFRVVLIQGTKSWKVYFFQKPRISLKAGAKPHSSPGWEGVCDDHFTYMTPSQNFSFFMSCIQFMMRWRQTQKSTFSWYSDAEKELNPLCLINPFVLP